MNVQLFERTKQWVKLTPAGQKFLEAAHRIVQEIEEGVHITQQVAAGQVGQIRLGLTESSLFSIAPKILSHYRSRFPQDGGNCIIY